MWFEARSLGRRLERESLGFSEVVIRVIFFQSRVSFDIGDRSDVELEIWQWSDTAGTGSSQQYNQE